jgi:hypothetical protein
MAKNTVWAMIIKRSNVCPRFEKYPSLSWEKFMRM